MVNRSDLFFFCEIDGKIVICHTGRREILQTMHLFLSISLRNGISLKTTSGHYCFIVVLGDNHKTNLHFIFLLTTEWKVILKCQIALIHICERILFYFLYFLASETKPIQTKFLESYVAYCGWKCLPIAGSQFWLHICRMNDLNDLLCTI